MTEGVPLRILTVLAHPDDESFGPAAMLARYAAAGADIAGIWFTRGEHGQTNVEPAPTPRDLAALREQDLRDAAALIGYRHVEILDHEDGTLAAIAPALLHDRVFEALLEYRPHVIFTFGPAGISRHADHIALHHATVAAFEQARAAGLDVRELYFDAVPGEIAAQLGIADELDGNPNTFIDVAAYQHVKLEALRCHARHILDAQNMLDRLGGQPQTFFTMYRAWPPVTAGARISELAVP
jgi:LmbE family N-acetylglucosaminyl deacetylase